MGQASRRWFLTSLSVNNNNNNNNNTTLAGEPNAGDVGDRRLHRGAHLLRRAAGPAGVHRVAALQAGAHDRQRRLGHPHRGHPLLPGPTAALRRQVQAPMRRLHQELRLPVRGP